MGFVITYEVDDSTDRQLSRRELAKLLGCHFNTLRKDELLIKTWVTDAAKYYRSDDPNKLESIELTPYLIWLLVQVRNLRNKGYGTDAIARRLFFDQPDHYSEKGFKAYVEQSQNRKARSAAVA